MGMGLFINLYRNVIMHCVIFILERFLNNSHHVWFLADLPLKVVNVWGKALFSSHGREKKNWPSRSTQRTHSVVWICYMMIIFTYYFRANIYQIIWKFIKLIFSAISPDNSWKELSLTLLSNKVWSRKKRCIKILKHVTIWGTKKWKTRRAGE